jgi:hypothetical protein
MEGAEHRETPSPLIVTRDLLVGRIGADRVPRQIVIVHGLRRFLPPHDCEGCAFGIGDLRF